jgi:hypothetical protein
VIWRYDGAVVRFMLVVSLSCALASAAAAAPLPAAPRRVVVVALGGRAGVAAELARAELAKAGLEIVTVYRARGTDQVLPPSDPARARAALAGAIEHFYANRLVEALEQLAIAEHALGLPTPATHGQLVAVRLWRGGILVKRGDTAAARAAVDEALRLDPDLSVPMDRFWPSFAAFVDGARTEHRRVRVRITDLPGSARVVIDGRLVGRVFEVIPGRHHLHLAADGFHDRHEEIDLDADRELPRSLDEVLPAAVTTAFVSALDRGDRAGVTSAAASLSQHAADVVVIRSDGGAVYGAVISNGVSSLSKQPGERELVAWIRAELPRSSPAAGWSWAGSMGLGVFVWQTALAWQGSSLEVVGSGGGWIGAIEATRSVWWGRAALQVGRDLTTTSRGAAVSPAPGSRGAGLASALDVAVGTSLVVAPRWLSIRPALHASVQTHRPGATEGPDPLPPLTVAGLGLDLGLELRPWAGTSLRVGAGIDLFGLFIERPRSAGDPNPPGVVRVEIGLTVTLRPEWALVAAYDFRRIEIQHVGTAGTAVTPALRDVRQLNEANLIWVGVVRRF